jgi:DNA-binding SARP family transcriptional activator
VELRLLGPLELLEDGRAVELPGGKPRALLGLLGLEAGRVVSLDQIVDVLWSGRPPATAAKLVHGYVSRLRKLLPNGLLLTRTPCRRQAGSWSLFRRARSR